MKYIKYSLIAALCFFMTQCTEEDGKTYPQQPAPNWSAVAEDFVSDVMLEGSPSAKRSGMIM